MVLQTSAVKEKTLISYSQVSHSLERWVLKLTILVHVHKKFNRILTISLYNVCIKLNSRKVNIAALLYVQTCIIGKDYKV